MSTHASSRTFPKAERLKSRKLIAQLFKEGKSFGIPLLRVYYIIVGTQTYGLQSGFAASARTFKKAVDRNRIKRLMREVYRLNKAQLEQPLRNKPAAMIVFFVYTGKELPEFASVQNAVEQGIRKLVKTFHEKNPAHS